MPEILALRHGKCKLNEQGRLNGQIDSDLAMEGERQARNLSACLGSRIARRLIRMPDMVYSSTLSRASQTSRYTTDALALRPAQELPALRERCLGEVEGMTYAEALAHVADEHKITTPHGVTYAHAKKYGFETFEEATARAKGFVDYINASYTPDDVIWAFTHGDFALALTAAWTGRPMEEIIQELCLQNIEGVILHGDTSYTKFVPDAESGELANVIRLPQRVA